MLIEDPSTDLSEDSVSLEGSDTADVANIVGATVSVDIKLAAVMEAATEASPEGVEDAGAAVLARSAWWRAARWRFFSFSAGPRCRGRRGGEGGGGKGAERGGSKWGAPGGPRVQLNATVAEPPLVVRLREASPPMAQTEMNSVSDAIMN